MNLQNAQKLTILKSDNTVTPLHLPWATDTQLHLDLTYKCMQFAKIKFSPDRDQYLSSFF